MTGLETEVEEDVGKGGPLQGFSNGDPIDTAARSTYTVLSDPDMSNASKSGEHHDDQSSRPGSWIGNHQQRTNAIADITPHASFPKTRGDIASPTAVHAISATKNISSSEGHRRVHRRPTPSISTRTRSRLTNALRICTTRHGISRTQNDRRQHT